MGEPATATRLWNLRNDSLAFVGLSVRLLVALPHFSTINIGNRACYQYFSADFCSFVRLIRNTRMAHRLIKYHRTLTDSGSGSFTASKYYVGPHWHAAVPSHTGNYPPPVRAGSWQM